jgi:hypothetical protein
VVNTTATTLLTLSGRPYAVFTVQAAEKITGLPVQLAMIYDLNSKVMYALWPTKANQFLMTGDRSLLKTALGSETVHLSWKHTPPDSLLLPGEGIQGTCAAPFFNPLIHLKSVRCSWTLRKRVSSVWADLHLTDSNGQHDRWESGTI